MRMRFLTRAEALRALELAGELHSGKRTLPPEIVEKKKEIERGKANAILFMAHTGAVDEGMVNYVVALKFELDAMYGMWVQSETPTLQ